jgi:hypothetical protein
MAKDKYEFIQEILENKKLTTSQRERILFLVSNELKKDNIHGVELNSRLERIENELNLFIKGKVSIDNINNIRDFEQDFIDNFELLITDDFDSLNPTNQFDQNSQSKKNEIVANPKHVADFMSLFNKRDGLKYLTHDYDEKENFDIESFLLKAKNTFYEKTKAPFSIPTSLWRIVEQFAFSKDPNWTAISEAYDNKPILTGWQKWAREKKDLIHPCRNEQYKTVINDFRRLTRIESSPGKDKPSLETLIDKCILIVFKEVTNDFEIVKMDLAKADFYTHVGNLKIALETIFEEIKKWADTEDKKKITIKYEREPSEDYFLRRLIITHQNSYPPKELQVILKEWQQKGNMGRIHEKLNGYCHWSVETKIEDKNLRINILKENATLDSEEIESANGFSHILTFFYK